LRWPCRPELAGNGYGDRSSAFVEQGQDEEPRSGAFGRVQPYPDPPEWGAGGIEQDPIGHASRGSRNLEQERGWEVADLAGVRNFGDSDQEFTRILPARLLTLERLADEDEGLELEWRAFGLRHLDHPGKSDEAASRRGQCRLERVIAGKRPLQERLVGQGRPDHFDLGRKRDRRLVDGNERRLGGDDLGISDFDWRRLSDCDVVDNLRVERAGRGRRALLDRPRQGLRLDVGEGMLEHELPGDRLLELG